ncbi:hypothetical protein U6B65_09420 [Oscillospiraceae bacterium MB08-C2-2]|nr:hypothetical protein U6B65_09420 [Oscillospiraceae bacterium MB08-C2-2]
MKKLTAIFLALSLLVISGCASREGLVPSESAQPPSSQSESEPVKPLQEQPAAGEESDTSEAEPQDDLEGFLKEAFETVAGGDKAAIDQYLDYNTLMGISEAGLSFSPEIYKAMLAGVKAELIKVQQVEDRASAQVRFTNISMGTVLEQYMRKAGEIAYNNALEDDPLSDEKLQVQFNKLFLDLIKEHTGTKATMAVELQMVKKDDKWRIQVDSPLRDAVLGGYVTASGKVGENAGI